MAVNSLSFFFMVLFGILFGYIFPDLLKEIGLKREKAHSPLAILALAFLAFLGYMTYPYFAFGTLSFNDISSFYGTEMFWITVALIIGGFGRYGTELLMQGRKSRPKPMPEPIVEVKE